MQNQAVRGFVFMLMSTFFFAVAGPIAKTLYSIGWSPGAVVLMRLTGAAILLLPPTLFHLRGRWNEVFGYRKTVVAYGVVSMAGVQAFFFLALDHLSVAVAILLEMMGAPLIIVFWLWARQRRRPTGLTVIGVAVCLAGVILVLDFRSTMLSWHGVALAIAAAACFASYFLVSSKLTIPVPSLAFTGLGMTIGAVATASAGISGLMPMELHYELVDFAGVRVSWFLPALLLVVFTVGAYICGIIGLRGLGPTVGSFANLTEVPFAAIAAWIVLAETMTPPQLVGGTVVILGIFFVKWGDIKSS
ncbi:EamA family transporter [Corynebacterium glyciniphilum]|uniref:EamA family transporter n=1 Tax=Corynebacterium glyciniphilum TaxID=1404244 RepID=UPI003DA1A4F7